MNIGELCDILHVGFRLSSDPCNSNLICLTVSIFQLSVHSLYDRPFTSLKVYAHFHQRMYVLIMCLMDGLGTRQRTQLKLCCLQRTKRILTLKIFAFHSCEQWSTRRLINISQCSVIDFNDSALITFSSSVL